MLSSLLCGDPLLSTHSPTALAGGRWWRQPPKGENAKMVHEVYDSLFFPSYLSFPLEGKCHVVAKGCTGLSRDMTLYHFPDRQSAAPLSGANTTLLYNTTCGASGASPPTGIYCHLSHKRHVSRFFAGAQYSGHMSSLFFEEIYCFSLKKGNLNTPPRKSIFFEYPSALSLAIPTLPLLCYRSTADVYPVM